MRLIYSLTTQAQHPYPCWSMHIYPHRQGDYGKIAKKIPTDEKS